jgi:FO synthase
MTHTTPALADELETVLDKVATDSNNFGDEQWELLLHATGEHLDALTTAADDLRRRTVGEAITQVVNRNVSSSAFRSKPSADGGEFGLGDLGDIATDAWALGATEVCIQGTVHPSEEAESYIDIARAVKRSTPGMHLHAFRPADIADFADRSQLSVDEAIAELRAAGVDSFPGTGVKILNERVRGAVAPGDVDTHRWQEIVTALHRAGARTTSVIFYGHVETARERIAHLRVIADIQAEAGGFTEFVPIALSGYGVPLVNGRAPLDEHRAMFAVSRLMLSGSVRHIQVPWTRLGVEDSATLLHSGADDLGGTLMDGRVLPAVGAEQGIELPLTAAKDLARRLRRPFRQRATDYTDPPEVSHT